ncbi:PIG-X [Phakopsora pachyrhizi]|nr:PIG-X [Phakopsora pachyrhizi]
MFSIKTELTEKHHGFHPTLKSTISINNSENVPSDCGLSLLYDKISPKLIVDIYEIKRLFEEKRLIKKSFSKSSDYLHEALIWGNLDLEAPYSFVDSDKLGGLLIPLSGPGELNDEESFKITVSVPLHLRYLPPSLSNNQFDGSLLTDVTIRSPEIGWVCSKQNDGGEDFYTEQKNLKILPSHLVFRKISLTEVKNDDISILIPVGYQMDENWVQLITYLSVWFTLGWVIFKLIKSILKEQEYIKSA